MRAFTNSVLAVLVGFISSVPAIAQSVGTPELTRNNVYLTMDTVGDTADRSQPDQNDFLSQKKGSSNPNDECLTYNACDVEESNNGKSDFDIKFGGYVKLDAIYDFDAIGSTDFFAPNQIPTDGTDGSNFRMHARQTRLNLEAHHDFNSEDLKIFVEGDFYGAGNAFRLRHGYGEYRNFTLGQTWSTFMDEKSMPDLINFESPTGEMVSRRALLRWSTKWQRIAGATFAVALEDPSPAFSSPAGRFESPLPDFVTRLRVVRDQGHMQVAGFVNSARFDPAIGIDSDASAWGAAISGSRKIGFADRFTWQATTGEGYERFRGFQSYDLDAAGNLFAIPAYTFYVGYEHHWSEHWKSVVAYSYAETDAAEAVSEIPESVDYVACNLFWQPHERFRAGVEYLYGSRTEFSGNFGDASRLQFGFWYYLK